MTRAIALTSTLVFMGARIASGHHVATTFTIDPSQSTLTVNASTSLFSDSDSNNLGGTISALFDFGESGGFPPSAGLTLTDAAIAPTGNYALRLGLPPFLGVNITASNLLAHVTTLTPPGTMTRTTAPGASYQFDASQFLLTVDQGTIVVSGSTNETTDLSQEPVTGASPAGTFGTLTFTNTGTSGPYTRLNAELTLPIQITETAESESGGLSVDLTLTAQIRATASFYVALSGVAGDFDKDGEVDGGDLAQWRSDFGRVGSSDADGDGDSDGSDYLTWQRQLGVSPPSQTVQPIPEPHGATLASIIGIAIALYCQRMERCLRAGSPQACAQRFKNSRTSNYAPLVTQL